MSEPTARERIRALVDALPKPEQYVISRIFFGGASLAQVGQECGHDKWWARTTRNRGLQRLRALLKRVSEAA